MTHNICTQRSHSVIKASFIILTEKGRGGGWCRIDYYYTPPHLYLRAYFITSLRLFPVADPRGGGGGEACDFSNCAHYPPPPKYFLTDWAPSPAAGWIRPCLCLYLLLLFPLYTYLSIRPSFISSLSLSLCLYI